MNHNTPAVEASGLGRDYGEVRALDALNLTVPAGSLVGLLGPNGAGKTTTLLLLATLLAPSRGSARLLGYDLTRQRPAIRRKLGLVFQESSLDGLLTVRENLTFGARLAGLRGREVRGAVETVIDQVGLGERASDPVKRLSGGWRRLVDIARATLHLPSLLLLDEPTVGLDPEHRELMWKVIETQRRERGTTVLFSTHYLTEAEPSDRVVLLAQGRVVAEGAPIELCQLIGEQVAEIEGDGAEALAKALRGLGAAVSAVSTERGLRVGITGPREQVIELAGLAPGIARFALRPPTLDDVYFASALAGGVSPDRSA